MKLLVDANVSKYLTKPLKELGIDIVLTKDIDPRMTDLAIAQMALLQQRIVLTNDKDFLNFVESNNDLGFQIILLKTGNSTPEMLSLVAVEIFKAKVFDTNAKLTIVQVVGNSISISTSMD